MLEDILLKSVIGAGESTANYLKAREAEDQFNKWQDYKDQKMAEFDKLYASELSGKATSLELYNRDVAGKRAEKQGTTQGSILQQELARAGITATGGKGDVAGKGFRNIQDAVTDYIAEIDTGLAQHVADTQTAAKQAKFAYSSSFDQQQQAMEANVEGAKTNLRQGQQNAVTSAAIGLVGAAMPFITDSFKAAMGAAPKEMNLFEGSIRKVSEFLVGKGDSEGAIQQSMGILQKMAGRMDKDAFNDAFKEYGITADMFNPEADQPTDYDQAGEGYQKQYETNPVTGEKVLVTRKTGKKVKEGKGQTGADLWASVPSLVKEDVLASQDKIDKQTIRLLKNAKTEQEKAKIKDDAQKNKNALVRNAIARQKSAQDIADQVLGNTGL